MERQRGKETEIKTHRQRDTDIHVEAKTQSQRRIDRDTYTERDSEGDSQRQRHTHRNRAWNRLIERQTKVDACRATAAKTTNQRNSRWTLIKE